MDKSNSLLGRMKKTIVKILPGYDNQKGRDFLVKINLAPMMGRRDAAYETAFDLSQLDIFSMNEDVQEALCRNLCELMDSASNDTKAIINILSSPDTVSREQRFLDFQQNIRGLLSVWYNLIEAKKYIRAKSGDSESFYLANSVVGKINDDEERLSDGEVSLVSRVRIIFSDTQGKILRYREYMTKSFSKPYYERYVKSNESHLEIFRKNFKID